MAIDNKYVIAKYKTFLNSKNYSENSLKNYCSYLNIFLLYYSNKDYKDITNNDIENFLFYYKFSSISQQNIFMSSIKLFFIDFLGKKKFTINFSRPRGEKKLPKVIDKGHLLTSISKIKNLKHKTIII